MWEYLEHLSLNVEQLNELGKQGWELIATSVCGKDRVYTFKRKLNVITCVKCGRSGVFQPNVDKFDISTGFYACGECLNAPKPNPELEAEVAAASK